MPPDLAQLSILISSNYPCLKLIFMVPNVFEPLKFDCNFFPIVPCFKRVKKSEPVYVFYGIINTKIETDDKITPCKLDQPFSCAEMNDGVC